jgi:hypothetical protein
MYSFKNFILFLNPLKKWKWTLITEYLGHHTYPLALSFHHATIMDLLTSALPRVPSSASAGTTVWEAIVFLLFSWSISLNML